MSILRAADLTTMRSADPLWRLRNSAPTPEEAGMLAETLGLPPLGFASPLGFWFAPDDAWTNAPPYVLELSPPSRLKAPARVEAGVSRVIVTDRRRPGSFKRRIILAIAGRSARVDLNEPSWSQASEAALLAVATCWRLEALDRTFDRLTDQSRTILVRGGRSLDLQRDGRSLILDLPELEGPLTDPARFASSREATRLYERLCTGLNLYEWRERIDERAEVFEGILDTFAVRRDHRQVIALEVLIIALLAVDIALSQFLVAWE